MSEYTEVLKKLPKNLVIVLVVLAVLFIAFLLLYVVVYRDRPVEIWGIKLGERDDELRKQLVQARAENELRIAPETHAAALARLKEAESKISQLTKEAASRISPLNKDVDNLKVQLKQREEKASQLTKELEETSTTAGNARRDLQLAKEENQRLIARLNEMKKTLDSSDSTKKKLQFFAADLGVLARAGSGMSSNQGGVVEQYNNILKSLKNDLSNDSFIQNVQELDPSASWITLGPRLYNGSQQLKDYLEKTYLK
jgi:DNA repair exonuclease SbcCD ATPase subunit